MKLEKKTVWEKSSCLWETKDLTGTTDSGVQFHIRMVVYTPPDGECWCKFHGYVNDVRVSWEGHKRMSLSSGKAVVHRKVNQLLKQFGG